MSVLFFLFIISSIVVVFALLQKFLPLLFTHIGASFFIYTASLIFSYSFSFTPNIEHITHQSIANLLPATVFLLLLQSEILNFFKLSKKMLLSYIVALLLFITLLFVFDLEFTFIQMQSPSFALFFLMALLLKPILHKLNTFNNTKQEQMQLLELGCACSVGAKNYYPLILLSLLITLTSQILGFMLHIDNVIYFSVAVAAVLGVLGSFTRLRYLNGSSEIATTMSYFLVALMASEVDFSTIAQLHILTYAPYLALYGVLFLFAAKVLKLEFYTLFIATAALVSPLLGVVTLAVHYNKNLLFFALIAAFLSASLQLLFM